MIMELPKKFYMSFAEVRDGELIIHRLERYEDLMYELTYELRKSKCIYCGKELKPKNRTLDHRYPRDTGGVSIVDNLYPTCSKCNSDKSNMTHDQYMHYRELSKGKRKEFRAQLECKREKRLRKKGFNLPDEWVTWVKVSEIIYEMPKDILRGKRYGRLVEHYEKYGNIGKPVVLDRSNKLLDGFNIVLFALDNDIKRIPAIKLDNVTLEQ